MVIGCRTDWCSFVIGREKDPSTSEVARLIQQSLEQDRRRAEAMKARAILDQLRNDEGEERGSDAEDQQTAAQHAGTVRHWSLPALMNCTTVCYEPVVLCNYTTYSFK